MNDQDHEEHEQQQIVDAETIRESQLAEAKDALMGTPEFARLVYACHDQWKFKSDREKALKELAEFCVGVVDRSMNGQ
jgi:hypothetical protein